MTTPEPPDPFADLDDLITETRLEADLLARLRALRTEEEVSRLREVETAARNHVHAECRCDGSRTHNEWCDLIVTEDALRAALWRTDP